MGPAVSIVASLAGAALAGPIGVGLLNAGLGLTAAQGILAGRLGGFLVSTALSQVGGRALTKKPKAQAFTTEAQGRALSFRGTAESHKVVYGTAKVSGPLIFCHTSDTGGAPATPTATNKMLHYVLPLAGHEVHEIGDVWLNDVKLDLDSGGLARNAPYYRNGAAYVRVLKYTGNPAQDASNELIADAGGVWKTTHRGRGIAYLYVRFEKSDDVFPFGPPNISAVVKGKKVYDPRTGLTAWSDNAVLCARDYLTSRDGSAVNQEYGFGIADARIDDTAVIAAANLADESVARKDGTTERRYTANGVLDTADGRLDNLGKLVSAFAGAVVEVQDKFRIHAAGYDAPVGSITDDVIAGPVSGRTRTPYKELFNTVRGVYVDPTRDYQATDFPPVTNATYVSQDNGLRLTRDLDLPFTSSGEAAQRIAKVVLEKARQGITVELPLMHHGVRFSVWDVVTVTNARRGWAGKPFRVMGWAMPQAGGPVTVSLQEESSASYAWSAGEATAIDAAPDTNLPSPFLVPNPGALTVTESLYVTRNGDGVKARVDASWVKSPGAFVREYQLEYKLRTATAWTVLPRVTGTSQAIEDIAPDAYDFRVKAVSDIGVSSDYATATLSVSGLLDPPTAPQNLTVSCVGGLAVLRWDQSPDLDVRIGGKVVFRHSPNTGDGWGGSTTVGNAVPGSETVAVLPLKAGIYLAKAVDSSGIESELASSVTTEQATVLAYTGLSTLTEHTTFPGTKTNSVVTGGVLKLSGSGLFDAIPDFDAVPSLDGLGGLSTAGSYAFSSTMDLGSVKRVRLTGTVRAATVSQTSNIDERAGGIDDWESFDGATAVGVADAVLSVRKTNDNPAGSPTWTAWHRLDSAEYVGRGFQFRLDLSTADAAYNIEISQLSVTAEEAV